MQLNELKPKKKKSKKRVGRGGKKGSYSGKGMKGQRSRAGAKFEPVIRGLIKRYPKLKGYKFNLSFRQKPVAVNIVALEKNFKDEEKVSPKNLIEKGIISKIKGKMPFVKILGTGDLTKKIIVEKCAVSDSARKKIEKAGGKIIPQK